MRSTPTSTSTVTPIGVNAGVNVETEDQVDGDANFCFAWGIVWEAAPSLNISDVAEPHN